MTTDVRIVSAHEFGAVGAAAFIEGIAQFAAPVVGLATGNTPVAIYEALRVEAAAGRASFTSVRPFALDEYLGPAAHPCSNRSYFQRYWDAIPGVSPVVQFDPEAHDLDAKVRAFAEQLSAAGGLDFAVLGVGANGHLAFNEPGSEIDAPARVVNLTEASRASARPCWREATPTRGMTLGIAEIMAARRVLLLANGAAKASIVERALSAGPSADCPASWLQLHADVVIVLDEAAAYRR